MGWGRWAVGFKVADRFGTCKRGRGDDRKENNVAETFGAEDSHGDLKGGFLLWLMMDGVDDGNGDGADSPCALMGLAKRGQCQPCQACHPKHHRLATVQKGSTRSQNIF